MSGFGVISFDALFEPVKANPVNADRLFGFDSEGNVNAAFTILGLRTAFGGGDWNTMANKPVNGFTPAAHTIGSHSNTLGLDAAADGTIAKKVAGKWTAVVPTYAESGDIPNVPAWVLGITEAEKANWNTAYGWGPHAGNYLPNTYVPDWADLTGIPPAFPAEAHTLGSHSDATGLAAATVGQLVRRGASAFEPFTPDFYSPSNLPPADASVPDFVRLLDPVVFAGYDAKLLEYVDFADGAIPMLLNGAARMSGILAVLTVNPFNPETQFAEWEAWEEAGPQVESFTFTVPVKGVPATEPNELMTFGQLTDALESIDLGLGARKVEAEYLITSGTAGTLVIGKWYNADNVLHEVNNQAIVFLGTPAVGEFRWDLMVGNADGTASLVSGAAGAAAIRPNVPAGAVVLFELIWNEEGESTSPPVAGESVWSPDRFATAVNADTTGKYAKIMEMDLGFAMDYAFVLDYGAPASLAANKVGSLHVAFVCTEANIIHSPTVKLTTVGFSEAGDFVLVQLPGNKAALYHKSTNYWMRLQWRVTFHNSAMSLSNFKQGEVYGALPAGANWQSEVNGGAVKSVTGDGVGGTASDPVIEFPTTAEIGAQDDLGIDINAAILAANVPSGTNAFATIMDLFQVSGTPTAGHVITSVAGVPTWQAPSGGGGISDASDNGLAYVRKSLAWTQLTPFDLRQENASNGQFLRWNALNGRYQPESVAVIGGAGTSTFIPKWNGTSALNDSIMVQNGGTRILVRGYQTPSGLNLPSALAVCANIGQFESALFETRTVQNNFDTATGTFIAHHTMVFPAKSGSTFESRASVSIARYEASGSASRTAYKIALTHGSGNMVDVLTLRSSGLVIFHALPTTDPLIAGGFWNDAGSVKISAG